MSLKEKIQNDLTQAVKEKDGLKPSTLRMVIAAISNKETEKRTKIWKEKPESPIEELEKGSQLTDEEIIQVLQSEIKKRKESILEFEKGKRDDLVKKEKAEMEILQKYLPEQLSEEEIKKLVQEAIGKVGAKEMKDMGKVMAELMLQVKGKADGSTVSKMVKELLSPKEK